MIRVLTRTVLLVEDNPDDQELTRLALGGNDAVDELLVAGDGVEALDLLLSAAAPPPRLVLLDLKLPRLSGLDVLRQLRAEPRTRLLPIVVLTSSLEEHDLRASYGLGANSCVLKPVDSAEFMTVVGHICRYWLLFNQPPPDLEAS